MADIEHDDPERKIWVPWTRRKFLTATSLVAAGLAAGPLVEACGGVSSTSTSTATVPKPRKGARVRLIQWNSFVPAADAEMRRQAKEYSDANDVEIVIETITQDDLIAKTPAFVAAGDGPDIIQMQYGWPHLYTSSCLDVTNEVNITRQKLGTIQPVNDQFCKVGSAYRAVPYTIVPNAWTYRTDYFQRANVTSFPTTWEDLATAATKLAAIGKPAAQTVGHAYGDSLTMWNPVLWGFGGKEVTTDGKVAINSKETEAAIAWALKASKAGMVFHPEWLDPDNNQAYHSDQISATLNGASIYIRERDRDKKFDKVTDNANMPSGPKGNFTLNLIFNHAVMKWTKEPDTAKAFILYIMEKENYDKFMTAAGGYNAGPYEAFSNHPIWTSDPKLKAFRQVVDNGKWPGWPASPSKKTSQSQSQYIVADMFAKAIAGGDVKAAVKEAEDRLKLIFEKP